jgi:hypothetical protein
MKTGITYRTFFLLVLLGFCSLSVHAAVLPVELVRFTASAEKQGVLLSRSRSSEGNNESFIVERAELSAFPGSGEMQFVPVGNLFCEGD